MRAGCCSGCASGGSRRTTLLRPTLKPRTLKTTAQTPPTTTNAPTPNNVNCTNIAHTSPSSSAMCDLPTAWAGLLVGTPTLKTQRGPHQPRDTRFCKLFRTKVIEQTLNQRQSQATRNNSPSRNKAPSNYLARGPQLSPSHQLPQQRLPTELSRLIMLTTLISVGALPTPDMQCRPTPTPAHAKSSRYGSH